jgi:hypothetical protein
VIQAISLVLSLSLVLVGLSWAGGEPTIGLPGPGGNPADINRDVLWLDPPDFLANTITSEVIGEHNLTTEIANDFLLEGATTVQRVTWWGGYYHDFEGPTGAGFNLRFYDDAGSCLPETEPFVEYIITDTANETLAEGGDLFTQYVYSECVCIPLPAGLYWFSAQMRDHNFPPQWGRIGADMVRLCRSVFRSEYFSYPEWVAASEVFGGYPYDASQMIEDECEATAIEETSWGAVKRLYW